jgi:hypothetical protein
VSSTGTPDALFLNAPPGNVIALTVANLPDDHRWQA